MTKVQKFAFVSPVWTAWQHRFMAGALRFVDAHSQVIIRVFAPSNNLADTAAEVEEWGAKGILSVLANEDLDKFLASLKRPIPIVNNALARENPGVLTILADFQAFVETAVNHFRQLGLRSLAIIVLEEGPQVHEQLVNTFLRIANPPSPSRASLMFPADREKLWHPHTPVKPVPAALADWLHTLPKPTGILAPHWGAADI